MNTKHIDTKVLALAALAIIGGGIVLLNSRTPVSAPVAIEHTARTYLEMAREALTTNYDITTAQEAFEGVLSVEPSSEKALYNLARIYYITNDYTKSLAAIEKYKTLYPENKRIHYVAGLSNAYAGNLPQAEREFKDFVASGLATWPGYLDLSWTHFQQGEFDEAEEVLITAIEKFGSDNAWLNTSLGAVYVAQERTDEAIEVLAEAALAAEKITPEEWRANFSFNNPAQVTQEMQQMREVIAYNTALAQGEAGVAKPFAPFANASPLGDRGGLAVSACGDACPHTTCTPSNVCGENNVGEYITCLDSCSVEAPSDPSGTCQVETSCGTAYGFNGCNGSCNITSYPVCSGEGESEATYITTSNDGDFDASEIHANLVLSPTLVAPGEEMYVQWISTEMTSCTLTGDNGDSWSGLYGEQLSSPITEQTTYTLTCIAFEDSVVTDTATVYIVPEWGEF